jgi:hypothetical protein
MTMVRFVALAALLGATGCMGSPRGQWSGDVTCGNIDWDMTLDVQERSHGKWYGVGEIDADCGTEQGTEPCTVEFDIELEQGRKSRRDEVELETDNCEAVGFYDIDCFEGDDVEFDGFVIEGDMEKGDFHGCSFELEREY